MSKVNAIQLLGRLAAYNQGRQDLFLNPLAFCLKLASLLRRSQYGHEDKYTQGFSAISDHINSSRFILRFLTGVTNLHGVLTQPLVTKGESTLISNIRVLQRVFNIGYNLAEIPSYIKMVAPMMVSYDGDAYGRLSCRFWLINTFLEVICIIKQRMSNRSSPSQFNYSMIAASCDLLLALNWSLPPKAQFLGEWQITCLGTMSSLIVFYSSWKELKDEEENRAKAAKLL